MGIFIIGLEDFFRENFPRDGFLVVGKQDGSFGFRINESEVQFVGERESGLKDVSTTADAELIRSCLCRQGEALFDTVRDSPKFRGIPFLLREDDGSLVCEPPQHLFIGDASEEEVFPFRETAEMPLIPRKAPWDLTLSSPDDPVAGHRGDHRNVHGLTPRSVMQAHPLGDTKIGQARNSWSAMRLWRQSIA